MMKERYPVRTKKIGEKAKDIRCRNSNYTFESQMQVWSYVLVNVALPMLRPHVLVAYAELMKDPEARFESMRPTFCDRIDITPTKRIIE